MNMGTVRFTQDHHVPSQNLLESLPSAIALIDDHGAIGDLNHRLATMTGYELEDLVGRDIQILVPTVHENSNFDLREEFARSPGTEHVVHYRSLTVLCRDGGELCVDIA